MARIAYRHGRQILALLSFAWKGVHRLDSMEDSSVECFQAFCLESSRLLSLGIQGDIILP